ncbi:tRNA (adenosine(37)-N6)-threonylcarbamoyltransferase complex dimerization subunit type 1 TsaB [Roseovarius sp. A21]|uniref:tRNA (Adenosine(37)-N6)-threonylcarbamoyltransferase complex dimerization subunit type 1 TsaB n=1 Tax=Roseovarius bejariae TaxID=2576383 RepID=A0A844CIS1_9RHOB|nr:tRNA (adenosine(37)-N6)-threonylcarbamoyltransferase complex dimerization subunit type 1 TsaB [Roseovarius bejariae]MRU15221.1 tRNA (adenosine(37)-N6)-threonylcarbamoyltransferase complex dimerization subunit type 1 TsaB [Roseovarius bejariae]
MGSEPLILGFDTSAAHCAAALLSGDRVLVTRHEEMGRGQAERLMPLLEEVLAEGGATWRDLSRIGVGVGPGNFTGIRIAVSAARGLALSLGIPAVGVNGFEAITLTAPDGHLPALPAPRDQLYIRPTDAPPCLMSRAEAEALGPLAQAPAPQDFALSIARIAGDAPKDTPPPAPLYLKPADAAPSRDAPPKILDDT